MKSRLIYACLLGLAVMACSKEEQKIDPHKAIRQAAEHYYTLLMEEKYDSLVLGIHSPDSLPEEYRSQLADAMAQYKVRETKRRGGIAAFRVVDDSLFADSATGYVDIELTFGDQSVEQTILPMICSEGEWKMK